MMGRRFRAKIPKWVRFLGFYFWMEFTLKNTEMGAYETQNLFFTAPKSQFLNYLDFLDFWEFFGKNWEF